MSSAHRNTAKSSDIESRFLQIVSTSDSGAFVLALPPRLRPHQSELESMLGRVFAGRPPVKDNLALAQQLSLNWCASKAKLEGLSFEECF